MDQGCAEACNVGYGHLGVQQRKVLQFSAQGKLDLHVQAVQQLCVALALGLDITRNTFTTHEDGNTDPAFVTY